MRTAGSLANLTRGTELASRVLVAERWWERLRGLIGRPALAAGDGFLIDPCRSVHTFWMRYPIDVLFLDAEDRVVALYPALPPRRVTPVHRSARAVLELPPHTLAPTGTAPGDQVSRLGPSAG